MIHVVYQSSSGVVSQYWDGCMSLPNFHVTKCFVFYMHVHCLVMYIEAVRRWCIGGAV